MNREIPKVITKSKHGITNTLNKAQSSNSNSILYWVNQQNKIINQYDSLENTLDDFILTHFNDVFENERWKQIQRAMRLIPRLKNQLFKKEVQPDEYQIFLREAMEDFAVALGNGKRQQLLFLRLLQLRNQSKVKINAFLDETEIEEIINNANSFPEARNELLDRLSAYSEDGQTVVVPTSGGGIRHYDINYYAKMVLDTTLREIQTAGTIAAAKTVGSDLVQVSSHNTVCPICIEFEGKIYSIDGSSPMFPPLGDTPPYHPNCKHSISVTFIETLRQRGIEDYVNFSRGDSLIHPTVKNWIPINERGIPGIK